MDIQLVSTAPDLVSQLQTILTGNVQAVLVPASTYLLGNAINRPLLAAFFSQQKVVALQSGGLSPGLVPPLATLVAYGAVAANQIRASGAFVDAILKGVKPSDLPVEQPTSFDLAVNLDQAKDMGLTFPQVVLVQATTIVKDGKIE